MFVNWCYGMLVWLVTQLVGVESSDEFVLFGLNGAVDIDFLLWTHVAGNDVVAD